MKIVVNVNSLCSANELFINLNAMERWGVLNSKKSFNQLTKQSLNGIICFFMAKELEYNGITIEWTNFPKIMTQQACRNCYASADVHQSVIDMTLEEGKIPKDAMDVYTTKITAKNFSPEVASWMSEGCETFEELLYKAASKLATLIELDQIATTDNNFKKEKRDSILSELDGYSDMIPGMDFFRSNEFLIPLRFIAKLRFQNRWSTFPKTIDCSVLGHLYDAGFYSYVLCIEDKLSEDDATYCFFLGLFHDLGELLTKDMPSPTKDGIEGYRKASEKIEEKLLEEELYPLFPTHLAYELRKMNFETPENMRFYKYVKGGDYLSAVSEIDRQVKGGTRYNYLNALFAHDKKFRDGTAHLGKQTRKFYKKICRFAFRNLFLNVQNGKKEVLKKFVDVMLH